MRSGHNISRSFISKNALKVLYHLKRNGFQAYLVGGAVRDLLLDTTPKDFDIATDAHPEQIKKIFHNCLLIGRRFRIAHIRFPDEIIEVTTFRAAERKTNPRSLSSKGMLLRDNVYGSIHEDAWRRDFSMNALYYNIRDFSIVDYCDGLNDIQHQQIRMIGNPEKRYQEDPVRLLRAIRLASKFSHFQFESLTEAGLSKQGGLLSYVPSSRLFEEVLKLFHYGHALKSYHLLKKYALFDKLFPALIEKLKEPQHNRWVETALAQTDQRFKEGKTLSPAFLFAILLWPLVKSETEERMAQEQPYAIAYPQAIRHVIAKQHQTTSITRFFSQMMRDIWLMQPHFVRKHPRQVNRLLTHSRFRAGYDFLLLRIACNEVPQHLALEWKEKAAFIHLEKSASAVS